MLAEGSAGRRSVRLRSSFAGIGLSGDALCLYVYERQPCRSTSGTVPRTFKPKSRRALPAFGLAIRVSETRYYLPARLLELAAQAESLAAKGPFTVRSFRDATGVGRNVVIEVLEHFDRTGFTRRTADTRTTVGNKNAVL